MDSRQDLKMVAKHRVLFVDDDANFLNGIRRSLRNFRDQWDLAFAESVDQAIGLAQFDPPDVVVSDYLMPLKNGFDLLREMRTIPTVQNTSIIILTGNMDATAKRKALDLGATDLLNKPVDREDLIARIRNSLRLKEYEDTIRRHNQELEQRVRQRTRQLELSRLDIIWRLAKAGEYRDEQTGNHIIRVGHYSRIICEQLGLPPGLTHKIFLGAPLHDIGKIGVPDAILLKKGKLSPEQRAVMMKHCEIGSNILLKPPIGLSRYLACMGFVAEQSTNQFANPLLQTAASIAMGHHEKWDGSGYPQGLSGEAIPVECRIVALADVYDALRSKRTYKTEYSVKKSLEIMRGNANTHFEPRLLNILENSIDQIEAILSDYSGDVTS
ncbi:MAG: response regulator [Syntrophobacteraceae bacterium]|nr:response regulator [Syntrophobacteraceae bacterium]